MILIELIKVFALSLISLTGLILLAGVIAEAMKNGFGPMQILMAVPILLPSLLPYTVPTTTLFATCIVYGRLSADNEILALKAVGTHILHVVWPALLLGIAASIVTLWLSLDVIPYTHFVLRTELGSDVEEMLYTMLKKDGYLRHPKSNYQIFVNGMDGRTLRGVVLKRFAAKEKGGACDLVACAKEAVLRFDFATRQILVDLKYCQIVDGNVLGAVDDRTLPLEFPSDWGGNVPKVRSTDMTWSELDDYEVKFAEELAAIDADIQQHQFRIDRGRGKSHYAEHIRNLQNERRIRINYIVGIQSERHMRPALALGCLCFALVGCPVGIWLSKSDYLSSFVTCFLPIVTIYYPLLLCFINFARAGKVDSWLSIHDANVLMFAAGAFLMWRLGRN